MLDDAAYVRVRQERSTLAAAVYAARAGPQHLQARACAAAAPLDTWRRRSPLAAGRTAQDFLVLAGAGNASAATLYEVQKLADRIAREKGAGFCCLRGCNAQPHAPAHGDVQAWVKCAYQP